VWDIGGQERIRALWRHYYQGTNAIIFVVDSNDTDRLTEAAEELENVLREEELQNACVLVLANKQDLPQAASINTITEKLGMYNLKNRKWYVQATCAATGEGVWEGMTWMSNAIKNK
jgi:small GTP-binding protein